MEVGMEDILKTEKQVEKQYMDIFMQEHIMM